MSALANHAFAKMNGIGNEIVVVDLRDKPAKVTAEEARAVASPQGVPYDQLMVLQPPRLAGTEAFIRIYNNDGSEAEACGNGMRCVVRRLFEKTGQTAVTYSYDNADRLTGITQGSSTSPVKMLRKRPLRWSSSAATVPTMSLQKTEMSANLTVTCTERRKNSSFHRFWYCWRPTNPVLRMPIRLLKLIQSA
jgi:diaminopimelate epimerase